MATTEDYDLEEWVEHRILCDLNRSGLPGRPDGGVKCSCGLSEALKKHHEAAEAKESSREIRPGARMWWASERGPDGEILHLALVEVEEKLTRGSEQWWVASVRSGRHYPAYPNDLFEVAVGGGPKLVGEPRG